MQDNVINLIVAGIGGQGINSLANVLAEFLVESGYQCQFTAHKGGAQSLGSVYAEFRISHQNLTTLGQGIPQGQLDILIALEPWEALRHLSLAHGKTLLWVEVEQMPLFVERSSERNIESPQAQLKALPVTIHWQAYREIAQQQTGTTKMANYFAGLDCLNALNQIFKDTSRHLEPQLFKAHFFKRINKAREL